MVHWDFVVGSVMVVGAAPVEMALIFGLFVRRHIVPFILIEGAIDLAMPFESASGTHFGTCGGESLAESHTVVDICGHVDGAVAP